MKIKAYAIVGARPQFIKAAALMRAAKASERIDLKIIHTGQHFSPEMSQIFFDEMQIPPPHQNLHLGGLSSGAMIGRMIEHLEVLFKEALPQWVIVFGDTNSTLAGAIAANKANIPVAHVEAGLRSYNKRMPEEMNRILTDHCSELLFTPTKTATANLLNEGFSLEKIKMVGDIMVDAFRFYQGEAFKKSIILKKLGITSKEFALATVHRAETVQNRDILSSVFQALIQISKEVPIIMPIHPATKQALNASGLLRRIPDSLHLIDPLGYLDLLMLQAHAQLILTDSGGIQKEAYLSKTPCLVLRNETEWIELIENQYHFLASTKTSQILDTFKQCTKKPICNWDLSLYGQGDAALQILKIIENASNEF